MGIFALGTTIEYEITEPTQVALVLYDAQGRLARQIYSSLLEEKGTHQVSLRRDNLPTGIYHCVLKTKDEIISKQLIITY